MLSASGNESWSEGEDGMSRTPNGYILKSPYRLTPQNDSISVVEILALQLAISHAAQDGFDETVNVLETSKQLSTECYTADAIFACLFRVFLKILSAFEALCMCAFNFQRPSVVLWNKSSSVFRIPHSRILDKRSDD